ncbi:MAG: LytTR family DNA-binding domain-containing protein [Alphaproteobacteria bacterium]|jgi:two-component system, LytTR family, response regulator|nr:LytTR family DNA-binding domain-containing protein [Alphaproteobacteria bacterium]MBU2040580.1 LytTR family DNA-binding domain-containing protein [Alphaproteobacteria bacterium]MBU2125231.1 LytTR family DNA-binding domain-containing protein [Alphaproteobacteria bacterium]MBU2209977.1 LytTR family DNA-binding domain-containing protein [Alphaproteobacteria bacterium]MBU2290669.1 LytTR family DNA-binding domain-containing protein [Alphaproteobacteria bacterium]
MSGLRVLVVDDEPLARRRASRLVRECVEVGEIDEAADITTARAALLARPADILLLDIQMPGGDGFALLESLCPPLPAVVIVTAFHDHALRAFDAKAIDYVTKPIVPARLRAAVERAALAVESRSNQDRIDELLETVRTLRRSGAVAGGGADTAFWVRTRGDVLRVPAERVIRFEAERDYVRIHTAAGNFLHHESLAGLERRLDAGVFVRIHRSSIVRKDAITRLKTAPFGALVAVLADGTELRVGRTYLSRIRKLARTP